MVDTFDIPPYDASRILVYGDLILDRYWYGHATRISPEAPVPVVKVDQSEARPGGAANVALNLSALGCQVDLMGVLGKDNEARQMQSLLSQYDINCYFEQLDYFATISKLRILGQVQQLLRVDIERPLTHFDDESILAHYKRCLMGAQVVILSDYAKGALFNVDKLIAAACAQNVPILIDPKINNWECYRGATLLTPNLKEFEAVVGHCPDEETLEFKARALIEAYDFEALLVTRGKRGMLLIQKNAPAVNLTAQAREVFDVTGAGDTVIAVMAASMALNRDLADAAKLANLAAGLVVRKLGAATVSVPELRREVQIYNDSHLGILSENSLLQTIADARAHGEKIVMTNGCFDVLHAGHVEYLEQARGLGDRLVVAVNSDDSVARLKGPKRPLNPLKARMEVLNALRSVDWVVSFSEDTPACIINKVLPDILVKGGDYRIEDIVGGDVVRQNGGEVLTIPFKKGFSTSSLIKKIQEQVE